MFHLKGLVKMIDQMGLEKTLPHIVKAVETFEKKGEKWVIFGFILGISLIVTFLVGSVIAELIYRHFAKRIFGSRPQPINP